MKSVNTIAILLLCLAACSTKTARLPELNTDYEVPSLDEVSPSGTAVFSTLSAEASFVGSEQSDVGLDGLFPVRKGGECRIAILPNGEDSFAQRMHALAAAKKSIRIQALIFTGDEAGLAIMDILKKKHAAGLDVRVIVDAFSNPSLQTQNMYFELKQHGVEVEGYEAFWLQWLNEIHPDPNWANMRFHEKMWLIDTETPDGVAVVGGLNVANEYFRVHPSDPGYRWRDQDVVVRGAVLTDMAAAFDRNFEMFVDIKKSRGVFDTNKAWDNTRSVLASINAKVPFFFSRDKDLEQRVAEMAVAAVPPDSSEATCRFFQNRPRLGETYIEQAYLQLIGDADDEILIANAYLVPSRKLIDAIKAATRRCVRVIVITNSPGTNDLPELTIVGRKYYREILAVNAEPEVQAACGAERAAGIWEWVGYTPEHEAPTDGTMHGKFAVFDRQASLVGSHNLDPRSEHLNSETAMVFENRALSTELATLIYEHDLPYCRPITPEAAATFEDPSDALYKLRKSFGDLFEEQL